MKIAEREHRCDRGRVADAVEEECVLVHVHRRDDRLVPRPAGGRVVDDVEAAQRVDRRQHEGDEHLVAEARQGDREELPDGARAVDARRVVEHVGDLLHPGDEEHHAEPEREPACRSTPIEGSAQVKSPSQGRTSEPRPTSSSARLSGPGRVVDPRPRLRDDDAGEELGQVQRRAEEPEAADRAAGERRGEQEAEHHRDARRRRRSGSPSARTRSAGRGRGSPRCSSRARPRSSPVRPSHENSE